MKRCVSTINALPSKLQYGVIKARAVRYGGFAIEAELPCINGLSAWFTIAHVDAVDDHELLMTEGAIGSAKDIAEAIVAALESTPAQPVDPRDEPYAWWAETGTAGASDGCNKPFWLKHEAVAYVRAHGGYVAPLFRRWSDTPSQPDPAAEIAKKEMEWANDILRYADDAAAESARAERAESENAGLREALEPFAKVAEAYDGVDHIRHKPALMHYLVDLTIDHFRRAAALANTAHRGQEEKGK